MQEAKPVILDLQIDKVENATYIGSTCAIPDYEMI